MKLIINISQVDALRLPLIAVHPWQGEAQGAQAVCDRALAVAGGECLLQHRAVRQGRCPVRQGAHLLIGRPGQGKGGVQLGGPLQVVQRSESVV